MQPTPAHSARGLGDGYIIFLQVGPEVSRAYYKEWAERERAWLKDSGMMNSKSLYNDGLDQFAGAYV